jgi:hypothetical protein
MKCSDFFFELVGAKAIEHPQKVLDRFVVSSACAGQSIVERLGHSVVEVRVIDFSTMYTVYNN